MLGFVGRTVFVAMAQPCSWLWMAASGDADSKEGQGAEATVSTGADV